MTAVHTCTLAEPSETVRAALGARYRIAGLYSDYRALLDGGELDAILVASQSTTSVNTSPPSTYREVVSYATRSISSISESAPPR